MAHQPGGEKAEKKPQAGGKHARQTSWTSRGDAERERNGGGAKQSTHTTGRQSGMRRRRCGRSCTSTARAWRPATQRQRRTRATPPRAPRRRSARSAASLSRFSLLSVNQFSMCAIVSITAQDLTCVSEKKTKVAEFSVARKSLCTPRPLHARVTAVLFAAIRRLRASRFGISAFRERAV
jgi:hypothetical protein